MEFTPDIEHVIRIPYQDVQLDGLLHIPHRANGIILFAHGSGSGRLSPRNQYVARKLQQANFATLLFDLLTREEDEIDAITSQYRFDIVFLANRLVAATNWLLQSKTLNHLSVGYFGASTGGGAALVAAAKETAIVKAVVSRGGRPDLAGEALKYVQAPTLLIVGGLDEVVIELNEQAYAQLNCEKKLEIVPGATHLFEEPGKLDEVYRLAIKWFKQYLK